MDSEKLKSLEQKYPGLKNRLEEKPVNYDLQRVREIQKKYGDQLLQIPGVVSVGTGVENNEPCLMIFTLNSGINIKKRVKQLLETDVPIKFVVSGNIAAQS